MLEKHTITYLLPPFKEESPRLVRKCLTISSRQVTGFEKHSTEGPSRNNPCNTIVAADLCVCPHVGVALERKGGHISPRLRENADVILQQSPGVLAVPDSSEDERSMYRFSPVSVIWPVCICAAQEPSSHLAISGAINSDCFTQPK